MRRILLLAAIAMLAGCSQGKVKCTYNVNVNGGELGHIKIIHYFGGMNQCHEWIQTLDESRWEWSKERYDPTKGARDE